jgi:hypothetical protein
MGRHGAAPARRVGGGLVVLVLECVDAGTSIHFDCRRAAVRGLRRAADRVTEKVTDIFSLRRACWHSQNKSVTLFVSPYSSPYSLFFCEGRLTGERRMPRK